MDAPHALRALSAAVLTRAVLDAHGRLGSHAGQLTGRQRREIVACARAFLSLDSELYCLYAEAADLDPAALLDAARANGASFASASPVGRPRLRPRASSA